MFPTPVAIPGYGVVAIRDAAIMLGVIAGVLVFLASARPLERLSPWRLVAAQAVIVVLSLTFGRAHYVLSHPGDYTTVSAKLAAIMHIGWSHHTPGAIVGVVVGAVLGARLVRVPLGKLADLLVPSAGIAYAIVRLGCFAHGCCHGSICFRAWCFPWPKGSLPFRQQVTAGLITENALQSVPIHPLQLYFVGMSLALTALSLVCYRRKRYDGEIALGGLVWFSGWLAILEVFRADDDTFRAYLFGYPQLMVVAAVICAGALVAFVIGARRVRRPTPSLAAATAGAGAIRSVLGVALLLLFAARTASAQAPVPNLDDPAVQEMVRGLLGDAQNVEVLVAQARRRPQSLRAPQLLFTGQREMRTGHPASAERMFTLALERGEPGPWTSFAHSGLGWVALERGRLAEAERHFAQGQASPPERILTTLLSASAEREHELATMLGAGSVPEPLVDAAWLAVGYVRLWRGANAAALEAFDAIGDGRFRDDAGYGASLIRRSIGDALGADETLERLAAGAPADVRIRTTRGLLALEQRAVFAAGLRRLHRAPDVVVSPGEQLRVFLDGDGVTLARGALREAASTAAAHDAETAIVPSHAVAPAPVVVPAARDHSTVVPRRVPSRTPMSGYAYPATIALAVLALLWVVRTRRDRRRKKVNAVV